MLKEKQFAVVKKVKNLGFCQLFGVLRPPCDGVTIYVIHSIVYAHFGFIAAHDRYSIMTV